MYSLHSKAYGGTVGLYWIDNYSTIYIYIYIIFINVLHSTVWLGLVCGLLAMI